MEAGVSMGWQSELRWRAWGGNEQVNARAARSKAAKMANISIYNLKWGGRTVLVRGWKVDVWVCAQASVMRD